MYDQTRTCPATGGETIFSPAAGLVPRLGAGGLPHDAGGLNHGAGGLNHDAGGLNHGAGGLHHGAGGLHHGAGGLHHDAGGLHHDAGGLHHDNFRCPYFSNILKINIITSSRSIGSIKL